MIARIAIGVAVAVAAFMVVAALGAHALLTGPEPAAPQRAEKPAEPEIPTTAATPKTLERVFAAAKGGDTIALASGNYGTFHGGVKPAPVTLTAQDGARVRMALDFDGAENLRVERMTLKGMELQGTTRNVTIADVRFTGMGLIRADGMRGAGILLERVTFAGIDKCDGCFEGRLTITGDSGAPAGIVVKDSTFGPGGVSDGILNGGHGVQIVGNHFFDLQGGSVDGVHVDAIQLYGSRGTVIRDNRIEDVATGIMAPDGADHELIERNLIAPGEYPYAILLAGDDGSTVRGNELPGGACAFAKPCGTVVIDAASDGTPSQGTVVEDNILGALQVEDGSLLGSDARNTLQPLG